MVKELQCLHCLQERLCLVPRSERGPWCCFQVPLGSLLFQHLYGLHLVTCMWCWRCNTRFEAAAQLAYKVYCGCKCLRGEAVSRISSSRKQSVLGNTGKGVNKTQLMQDSTTDMRVVRDAGWCNMHEQGTAGEHTGIGSELFDRSSLYAVFKKKLLDLFFDQLKLTLQSSVCI